MTRTNRPPRRDGRRRSPVRSPQRPDRRTHGLSSVETLALAAACVAFIAVFALVLWRGAPAATTRAWPTDSFATSTPAHGASEPQYNIPARQAPSGDRFDCVGPRVTDGDTLRCGQVRVRLASIDAPELPGHCRPGRICTPGDPFASTESLRRLIGRGPLECERIDTDRYGRTVAFCYAAGRNLSCAQVQGGFTVVRYGKLSCD